MTGKAPRLIDVIICDEVRQENTGKLLVIGMYLDNIGVPQLPFVMPVLTFLCKWYCESGSLPLGSYELKTPAARTLLSQNLERTEPSPEAPAQMLVPIRFQALHLTETGKYRLSFKPEGGRSRIIASFRVHTPIEAEES